MILETTRLYLRQLTQNDLHDLCLIIQDDETMYAYEGALSDNEAQEWLDRQLKRYEEYQNFGAWAVILKENNSLIGQIGLTLQPWHNTQVLELGYLLNKNYWHQGLAYEAAKASLDYAFKVLNAKEVCAIIRDTNTNSQKLALRLGMKPFDHTIKHYRGIDMPHTRYIIKKDLIK